jgi:hypothetical protein
LLTLQPILVGSRHVSWSAASSRATAGPRVEWHVCVVERSSRSCAVRSTKRATEILASVSMLLANIEAKTPPLAILSLHLSCEEPLSSSS